MYVLVLSAYNYSAYEPVVVVMVGGGGGGAQHTKEL